MGWSVNILGVNFTEEMFAPWEYVKNFPIIMQKVGEVGALAQTFVSGLTFGTSFRNSIVNGNLAVNQRVVPAASTTYGPNSYTVDRWKSGTSGLTMSLATAANGDVTPTITAGTLVQVIEGGLYLKEGGTYTLSWIGTAQARVNGGAYAASPITVTGLGPGANATVEFATGSLGLVMFERGTKRTTFEYRDDELRRCQRYAQVVRDKNNVGGPARTTTSAVTAFQLPVDLRATPTLSILTAGSFWVTDGYSNDWQANPVSILFQSLTPNGGTVALDGFTSPGNLNVGRFHLPSASQGTARLLLSAEL